MPFIKLKVQSSEFRVKNILHSKFSILNSRGFTLIGLPFAKAKRSCKLETSFSELGFTLIELMVTLLIIGIVFGIVMTATGGIQKQSRNAQRKTDLSKIQTALQQYYVDQNKYPNKEVLNGTSIVDPSDSTKVYLNSIPKDPQGSSYYYQPVLNKSSSTPCLNTDPSPQSCHYYYLCSTLEGTLTDICNGSAANGNYILNPL